LTDSNLIFIAMAEHLTTDLFPNHPITVLANLLGQQLQAQSGWVASAESCTGGLLAGALTAIPGSSSWFDQGWVTYSNAAKHRQLGVSLETLERHGAVSEATAQEMALGVLAQAPQATLAMSTTGIAGPGGASAGKPVGLVCFGWAQRSAQGVHVTSAQRVFAGDRHQVRLASVEFALQHAINLITTNGNAH
jgi:nicotinamide-nucleotide amidase